MKWSYWRQLCLCISFLSWQTNPLVLSSLKKWWFISSQFCTWDALWGKAALSAQDITSLESRCQPGRVLIRRLWGKNLLPSSFLFSEFSPHWFWDRPLFSCWLPPGGHSSSSRLLPSLVTCPPPFNFFSCSDLWLRFKGIMCLGQAHPGNLPILRSAYLGP